MDSGLPLMLRMLTCTDHCPNQARESPCLMHVHKEIALLGLGWTKFQNVVAE